MSKKSIIQLSEFDITQKIIEAMSNVCTRSVLFSVKNESKDVPTIAEELKISISTVYKTLSNFTISFIFFIHICMIGFSFFMKETFNPYFNS